MGWLRTVTVGRDRDKVKPNGKKGSNLPVMTHPQAQIRMYGYPGHDPSDSGRAVVGQRAHGRA